MASFHFDLIIEHRDKFAEGVVNTLELLAISLPIGFVIALITATILLYQWPGRRLAQGYVYVFRGSPMLVQLFLIYNGLAQFEAVRDSFLWLFLKEPFWCAVITISLNTGAYTARIFHGAMESLPKGEIEAAYASGMDLALVTRRIIIPAALRRALPAYGNEVIFTLHSTALVSMVTIMDILGAGRWVNTRYYVTFEGYISAGLIYALLTASFVLAFRWWEKRFNRHLFIKTT